MKTLLSSVNSQLASLFGHLTNPIPDMAACSVSASFEYTYPFGKAMGGLLSSVILPEILQITVEMLWWANGTSAASLPKPSVSQVGHSGFLPVAS